MGRPTELSVERVAAAAEAMLERGSQPTVDSLRAELGGSDSTILKLLRLWKEQRTSSPPAKIPTALTPEVIAIVQGWATGLLARAQEDHDATLAAVKEERMAAERAAAQRSAELEIARDAVTELEQLLRQRDNQLIAAQADRNDLMIRMAVTEHEKGEIGRRLEEARREIAAAEQRAALAEQKASLVEQMASTARSRSARKTRGRGVGTDGPPPA